jgi:hypothetical protein
MAKQTGIIKLSGKLGDNVYVHTKKKTIVRRAPVRLIHKNEVVFRMQYGRTALLNKLAGGLNRVFKQSYGVLVRGDLYHRMQKQFRKEPLDDRCLLLMQLPGMELHPNYPMSKLGDCRVTTALKGKKFIVTLSIRAHPNVLLPINCYYYELALISWNDSDNSPAIQQQYSEWIKINSAMDEFEFIFPIAGARQWLLCLRQSPGVNETETVTLPGKGMQMLYAGTFDAGEKKYVEEVLAERKIKAEMERQLPEIKNPVLRISPKRK